jgi:diguanylate cyclase
MNEPKHPSDIAREALKRLATSQLAPTPANYQACYNEIANLPNVMAFPDAQLRELLGELPARNAVQAKQLDRLSAAIGKRSWQGVKESLAAFAQAGESRPHEGAVQAPASALPGEFASKLARFVECVLPALGEEDARILSVASELLVLLRQPTVEIVQVQALFGSLTHQAVFAAEEQDRKSTR